MGGLCFLQGAGLPDPYQRLLRSGNGARHIKMQKGAATPDEPSVRTNDCRSAGARESVHPRRSEAAVAHQIGLGKAATATPQRRTI